MTDTHFLYFRDLKKGDKLDLDSRPLESDSNFFTGERMYVFFTDIKNVVFDGKIYFAVYLHV